MVEDGRDGTGNWNKVWTILVMCDIHDINIYHDIIARDTIWYKIILYRYTRYTSYTSLDYSRDLQCGIFIAVKCERRGERWVILVRALVLQTL